jgi:hypothetical protein
MKLELSRQSFEKYSKIMFHETQSSGSRVVPGGYTDGQTDRHDNDNSRFSQYCDGALKTQQTSAGLLQALRVPGV